MPNLTEDGSGFDLQLTAGFASSATQSAQADGKELQTAQEKIHLPVLQGQTVALVKEAPSAGWAEADNTIPGPKSILMFLTPATVTAHFTNRLVSTIHRESGGGTTAVDDGSVQSGK